MSSNLTRRELLVGISAGLAGSLVACTKQEESVPRKVSLGSVNKFSEGANVLSLERILLLKDKEGFAAMQLVCTHQSCALQATPNGFSCPCHGAQFSESGKVLRGPANKDLPWFALEIVEGELIVDLSKEVSSDWRISSA